LAIIANSGCGVFSADRACASGREAADIGLELRRDWTGEDVANFQIDVDQMLRRSKLRLAVAKADPRISQQPLEQDQLPVQIHFLRLDGYQELTKGRGGGCGHPEEANS
jgi:hypothetical protein